MDVVDTPEIIETSEPEFTVEPVPTIEPALTSEPVTSPILPPELIEYWMVDLEWPSSIYLGESDVIRLTLIPSESEIKIEIEFADHERISREIPITRPEDYTLNAVAELSARNFDVSPIAPQTRALVTGKSETWHWTIAPTRPGVQRISISVNFEWVGFRGDIPERRQFGGFSQAVEIKVQSILGMTKSEGLQTMFALAVIGLVFGFYIGGRKSGRRKPSTIFQTPDPNVTLEPQSDIHFSQDYQDVFQAMFKDYARVVIEKEFMSGYSGARTFMAIPIRADQKTDAHTIIKINEVESIEREYDNYLTYVKNTLPPITARIQQEPVSVRNSNLAALRYTFLGAPGSMPTSLHQALKEDQDPIWLQRIFDAFGPNWWLQHNPYIFRLGQEYDRKLPAHYVIEPDSSKGQPLNGAMRPDTYSFAIGGFVELSNFKVRDRHLEGKHVSLIGQELPGEASLRVTWLGDNFSKTATGRILATRDSILSESSSGFELFGLPNPLEYYPLALKETIQGTKSTIHGDLNLQNILVGPGGFVWLIDFAETREGHTLFDFSHLAVELIAHVINQQIESPKEYIQRLKASDLPLLNAVDEIVKQCLFNNTHTREYEMALFVSCLGALKYKNLDAHAKHLLFLTAAHLSNTL
jgi:hypothetical protein